MIDSEQRWANGVVDFRGMDRLIFSTRGLVILLGLFLGLAPGWLPWLADADAWSYRQAAALSPSVPAERVILATLPSATGADPAWLADAAGRLESLDGADAMAVVLPARWLPALSWTPEGRALLATVRRHDALLGVVTGDGTGWRADYQPLPVQPGGLETYLDLLPATLFLQPPERIGSTGLVALSAPAFPVAARDNPYPLVWRADTDTAGADLAAMLAGRAGIGEVSGWRRGRALLTGDGTVPTGLTGKVFVPPDSRGAVTVWTGGEPRPEIRGRVALIGPEALAQPPAAAVAALLDGTTARTPYWATAAGAGLVLLLAVYAALLVPRLGWLSGALLTLLLLLGVVGAEAAAYLKYGIWLGWTPAVVLLAAGHPLAMLARLPGRRLQRLVTDREHALRRLGAYQVDHGDYEDAFHTLRRCQPGEEVMDLVYRCGTALARKRQYEQAKEVFGWLQARRPGYRDVKSHLQSLQPSGRQADPGQTVVIAEGELARPLIGRYEVVRELGRGATGVVYLGRDPKIGREVAIKTLAFSQFDPDELETFKTRFAREAEAAGRLSHPNIVTVYDVGEEADLAFIAMDYAAGRTLAAFTGQRGLLPVGEALSVIAEVADALDYAHDQGIVHRDIKPANIIYDAEQNRVKVTDFGIARVMDSSRTRTGSIVGTPSYMAPEQLTGDTVDGRSDIFSLGVTLYQMVTGDVPFRGENLAGIAYQITSAKPKGVRTIRPELPAAVARIVNRALQKSPEKRYQSAGEMAEALRKAATRAQRTETSAS